MRYALRALYAVLGIAFIAAQFATAGLVMASIHYLQFWSFPAFFGIEMMMSGLMLLVVLPASKKSWFMERFPWARRLLPMDEGRLSTGFWGRVRTYGPFALVLVAALLIGAIAAAIVIRVLALKEKQVVLYVFATNLIAVGVKVSVYLGALQTIRSFFSSLF